MKEGLICQSIMNLLQREAKSLCFNKDQARHRNKWEKVKLNKTFEVYYNIYHIFRYAKATAVLPQTQSEFLRPVSPPTNRVPQQQNKEHFHGVSLWHDRFTSSTHRTISKFIISDTTTRKIRSVFWVLKHNMMRT